MLTDTHTHLYAEQFDEDRDAAIQRAFDAGVKRLFLPNIDRSSLEGMLALAQQYPENCFPMMGLHPCSVKEDHKAELELVEAELRTGKYCAVGEIGIDLYWDKTFVEAQKESFSIQVEWAKELKLPIVIHVRESFNEVFELLDVLNDERLTGIFHCFTGSYEQAQKALSYGGFKLGLGGVLTFKNAGVAEVARQIPLEHLVLETDAPYLAPTPHRGKRNEPSYVKLVAEKLAELHEASVEEVAAITTANSKTIFGV